MPVSHPPPNRFAVEPRKVALYLLNIDHSDGRSKANFFIRWGFDPARPQELTAALIDHPRIAALTSTSSTAWSLRFVYEARRAERPRRFDRSVRTGEDVAQFVIAYRF